MTDLFLSILDISITAGIVALAVMFFRIVFKGAPRWISCMLWMMVALRLLCPWSIESEYSLIPDYSVVQQSSFSEQEFEPAGKPLFQSDTAVVQDTVQNSINEKTDVTFDAGRICAVIWLCGMSGMLIYGAVSYYVTRFRVRDSIPLKDNIRQSEKVKSPFILGVFRPYIYIPFSLDEKTKKYVLAHEQAHLKRLDHVWKPLGFVLLCIHWFNPIMWVSYILLCRDIEVACDEKVIRGYSFDTRKAYATALLDCKISHSAVAACPLAFGEVGVKERIRKTLKYKKTAKAIIVVSIILISVASVGLLTDPVSSAQVKYYSSDMRVTAGYQTPTEPAVTEPYTEPYTTVPVETELYTEPLTEPATETVYYDYSEDYSYDYSEEERKVVCVNPSLEEFLEQQRQERLEEAQENNYNSNSGSSFENVTNTSHNKYGTGILPDPIVIFPSP